MTPGRGRAKAGAVARTKSSRSRSRRASPPRRSLVVRLRRLVLRLMLAAVVLLGGLVAAFGVLPVPATPYMLAERVRIGTLEYDWVAIAAVSPVMARSAVAAEDARFCQHWGFDIAAIRAAVEGGARRGGSTITQQTVKNVFLWHGRSWPRKALEALLTPVVEAAWSKRRILEVYLNVAEFDAGVFGVQAAARHYFDTDADRLSPSQAARLAAILPNPKDRSAAAPSPAVWARAQAILDGAETIRRDGRAGCFAG